VSLKSALVILWACLIAGAAVASESQRLCELRAAAKTQRLHEYLQHHEDGIEWLIVAEVDVTN